MVRTMDSSSLSVPHSEMPNVLSFAKSFFRAPLAVGDFGLRRAVKMRFLFEYPQTQTFRTKYRDHQPHRLSDLLEQPQRVRL